MSTLSPEEREKLERRLEEIDAQIRNLNSQYELSLEECAELRFKLTHEWLAAIRRLAGRPV